MDSILVGSTYRFTCTFEEASEASNDLTGLCRKCGNIETGVCEPDARNYECSECGLSSMYGFEEMLLMGYVGVIE